MLVLERFKSQQLHILQDLLELECFTSCNLQRLLVLEHSNFCKLQHLLVLERIKRCKVQFLLVLECFKFYMLYFTAYAGLATFDSFNEWPAKRMDVWNWGYE